LLQVAGEVLSVVSQQSIEEAQKNATRNKITNCHYFGGSPEAVLLHLSKKIGYEKACVVMICSANRSTTCEYWRLLE
jgi:tRNA/tmRNA/rRNA uracil-C5-methylase (TrmA/RlmC/RlmD family)